MQERGKNGIAAVKKLKKSAEELTTGEPNRPKGRKRKLHYPPIILHDAISTSSASSSSISSSSSLLSTNIEEDYNDVELNRLVAKSNLPFHRHYYPNDGVGEAKKKQASSSVAVKSMNSYNEND
jgi:hypothetical protein